MFCNPSQLIQSQRTEVLGRDATKGYLFCFCSSAFLLLQPPASRHGQKYSVSVPKQCTQNIMFVHTGGGYICLFVFFKYFLYTRGLYMHHAVSNPHTVQIAILDSYSFRTPSSYFSARGEMLSVMSRVVFLFYLLTHKALLDCTYFLFCQNYFLPPQWPLPRSFCFWYPSSA